jgi:hypothetical protein
MGRFENAIALAKASWSVLRDNKQLALLPLFSWIAALLVMVGFLVPILAIANGGSTESGMAPVNWVLALVAYLAVTYVIVFFNAALVYAADCRLRGEQVTIGEAVHGAASRAHVLLPWAVLSATVSLVLRMIEERAGIVGRIVGAIAGLAWSLVTFLVLPILVIEGIGVGKAVRRSSELFKRTWGENVITNAGIGLLAVLATLAGAVVVVLGAVAGGPVLIASIVVYVVWVLAVSLVAATLTGILQVALYRFATAGEVQGFPDDVLQRAFRPRGDGPSRLGF